jgi:RsiW-degrading membrane proteinase PrsW (M82 family)
MWTHLVVGGLISLVNFGIHALLTGVVIEATRHTAKRTDHLHAFFRLISLLTITMVCLMVAHVCEIAVWSAYYHLEGVAPIGTTAFEFAFENYTALGYGEPAPPEGKRLVGPITSLNGLLLIGWSVAVIFEVMRMAEVQIGRLSDKDES